MYYSENPSAIHSKNEITTALLELMKQYRYQDITVKQIILETDLTRKTFYRNYSSKDDVLVSHIRVLVLEYIKHLTAGNASDIFSVIFDECMKNRELLLLLSRDDLLHMILDVLNTEIPALHDDISASESPFIRIFGDLEPDYLIAFNIGAVWNVVCKWIERGMTDPPEKLAASLRAYIAALDSAIR